MAVFLGDLHALALHGAPTPALPTLSAPLLAPPPLQTQATSPFIAQLPIDETLGNAHAFHYTQARGLWGRHGGWAGGWLAVPAAGWLRCSGCKFGQHARQRGALKTDAPLANCVSNWRVPSSCSAPSGRRSPTTRMCGSTTRRGEGCAVHAVPCCACSGHPLSRAALRCLACAPVRLPSARSISLSSCSRPPL